MYKLEHIQRCAIRVLYNLNFASLVSISYALMLLIDLNVDIFVNTGYCYYA